MNFGRDEIQRIKAGNPDISHREAFSAAAKNVNNLYIHLFIYFILFICVYVLILPFFHAIKRLNYHFNVLFFFFLIKITIFDSIK